MTVKPTIAKSLNDRKVVLTSQAEELRAQLAASAEYDNARRKSLAETEAEIADIDEILAPVKK